MTTIAYRDGVIAADRGTSAGSLLTYQRTKIARNPAGDLLGACGSTAINQAHLDWFRGGEKGPQPELKARGGGDCDIAIIVRVGEAIIEMDDDGSYPINELFTAIGSGREFALGAMFAGATAEEAIEAAMRYDPYSWGGIDVLELGNASENRKAATGGGR